MDSFANVVLNTVLVGIPEEIAWVVLTLIFLRRFDLLDRYRLKENIKWILIPVVPSVLLINIFKYIIITPKIISFIICEIVLYILLYYTTQKTSIIKEETLLLKVILYGFLSLFVLAITELVYAPFILQIIKQPVEVVNQDIWLNFLLSCPARLLQFTLIAYLINKYNTGIALLVNIVKDKTLLLFTTVFLGIMLLSMFILTKAICSYYMIENYSLYIQAFISVCMVIIPILFMLFFFLPIGYLSKKIYLISQSHNNMFEDNY